jgi:HAD superfamily hydrolase (TIGR01509 family)
MIAFGWELAQRHNVYFMTNAGPWHVPYIYDAFPNLCFFKDDAVSCYLHAVKPEIEFYRRALGKFGIDKKTCIFVDDRPENVKGAQAFGLHSIPYTHTAETIHAVRDAINQFQDRRV